MKATEYEMILFDLDNTLLTGYMDDAEKRFNRWEVLPGRLNKLYDLRAYGVAIGIVTNQGGVAFGKVTETEVYRKLQQVASVLLFDHLEIYDGLNEEQPQVTYGATGRGGLLRVFVCYSDARSGDARYNQPADVSRRKPSGAMIQEARGALGAEHVLFVGDRPEDETAAKDAGVAFAWAEDFFR